MLTLNLGCGYRKIENAVNIDSRAVVGPDLICDVTEGLPFSDDSVDQVFATDFLEHIKPDDVIGVIEEIYRVLKPNGFFFSLTPSTDGRGAFQDPTHRSFWNINSFIYYSDDEHRKLYGIKAKFRGTVKDILTNDKMKIIHTKAELYAVK